MANPMVAKYTKQMSAMLLPGDGGEIGAWAAHRGVPVSQVMRELVEAGLKARRGRWNAEFGALPAALLEEHVERCTRQGGKQLSRRRDYDENRRGAAKNPDAGTGAAYVAAAIKQRGSRDAAA